MHEMVASMVRKAIGETLQERGVREPELGAQTSLLELGMDSLKLVELAVILEETLHLREFPMQRWADEESARDDRRFTVGSLIDFCCSVLSHESGEEV